MKPAARRGLICVQTCKISERSPLRQVRAPSSRLACALLFRKDMRRKSAPGPASPSNTESPCPIVPGRSTVIIEDRLALLYKTRDLNCLT
ncbi:UNVERIFIED_CONTAM: hypothetical protein GTU68_042186 [Idotea baltica]|nr:hypothetical protein [Idotea baltica]